MNKKKKNEAVVEMIGHNMSKPLFIPFAIFLMISKLLLIPKDKLTRTTNNKLQIWGNEDMIINCDDQQIKIYEYEFSVMYKVKVPDVPSYPLSVCDWMQHPLNFLYIHVVNIVTHKLYIKKSNPLQLKVKKYIYTHI